MPLTPSRFGSQPETASALPRPQTMWMVGTFPPRQCGIATFTEDLRNAIAGEIGQAQTRIVAMNDAGGHYAYDASVELHVPQHDRSAYRLTADLLNANHIDVAVVQHEYGIFGGNDGAYVLDLIGRLRMPVLTTLHTILTKPSDGQRKVLTEIAQQSARVVVMTQRGQEILQETYAIPAEKIAVIPHGIHDLPFIDPHFFTDQFSMQGKRVLLTFGLLGPGKGIEVVIRALPEIVKQHPNTVYVVLGATHPHVVRHEGERYREFLKQLAADLGVAEHVQFHDQFVSVDDLSRYLGLADIYVTPYPNPAQITSGTLAYAVGAGKAVVSTPIWHAEELLSDGRGVFFPFNDSDALAKEVNALLSDDEHRNSMRKRAYLHGRSMIWQEIGKTYVELGAQALAERRGGRVQLAEATLLTPDIADEPNLDHLERMTDDTGMLQHALFAVPDRRHGYCTDDNARALITSLMHEQQTGDARTEKLAERYLTFLAYAFDSDRRRFRNFMSYDRKWLEDVGSDDSHGRALWALGFCTSATNIDSLKLLSYRLFKDSVDSIREIHSPRAWAFAILGMSAYRQAIPIDAPINKIYGETADRLERLVVDAPTAPNWPWFEPTLTYDNGRIPQALILAGHELNKPQLLASGLSMLNWLCDLQTTADGTATLVSHVGWNVADKGTPIFDQQPLEAAAMVEACASAYRVTGDAAWFDHAKRFHLWFLGNNPLGMPLRDLATGGCADGLQASGVNFNQGAESTLALLSSSLTIRDLYRRAIDTTSTSRERDAVA